jgi:hypothetical protein
MVRRHHFCEALRLVAACLRVGAEGERPAHYQHPRLLTECRRRMLDVIITEARSVVSVRACDAREAYDIGGYPQHRLFDGYFTFYQ